METGNKTGHDLTLLAHDIFIYFGWTNHVISVNTMNFAGEGKRRMGVKAFQM